MQATHPFPPSAAADPAASSLPVPLRARHDGFTPERQVIFIRTLAETGRINLACKAAGVSRDTAYTTRRHPDAVGFAAAWEAALSLATQLIADLAVEHALEGEVIPVFYKGEKIGERVKRDPRLWAFLLSAHDPARYGRQSRETPDKIKSARRAFKTGLEALATPADDFGPNKV